MRTETDSDEICSTICQARRRLQCRSGERPAIGQDFRRDPGATADAQIDNIVMALGCDRVRVVSFSLAPETRDSFGQSIPEPVAIILLCALKDPTGTGNRTPNSHELFSRDVLDPATKSGGVSTPPSGR